MRITKLMARLTLVLGVCALLGGNADASHRHWGYVEYDVTITNITGGQVMSPPVVVAHNSGVSLFDLGEEALPELADLAEDAATDGLVALLGSLPQVSDVAVGGDVIPPGESMTIRVRLRGSKRLISIASMLVTTNDTFAGLRSLSVNPWRSRTTARLTAYDAGSEANNEDCDFIPGPPCGNGGVRDTEGAEGFVHVSRGIQGIGDVGYEADWRNPVASVSIKRVY